MRNVLQWLVVMLGMVVAVDSAAAFGNRSKIRNLQDIQDAYAAAVRWNDIEGAASVVDPAYMQAHPLTDLHRSRYAQLQISGYSVLRTGADNEDEVRREVEIRMINRNTQAERSVRVLETWRWDAKRKHWWLSSGLPDLWQGE
jgi:hypothetical protein